MPTTLKSFLLCEANDNFKIYRKSTYRTVHPLKSIVCRAAVTAPSPFRFISVSLSHLITGIVAYSSLLNGSSSFRFDGLHMSTSHFKSDCRFSVGLRSGLWAIPSHLHVLLKPLLCWICCVFGVIVLLGGEALF